MFFNLRQINLFLLFTITISCLVIGFSVEAVESEKNCSTKIFKIDSDFLSSGFSRCEIIAENYIKIYVSPEDIDVINPSPWYAFRKSTHNQKVFVEIFYEKFKHRYHPKISIDSVNWDKINSKSFRELEDGQGLLIEFLPLKKETIVSAQEIISSKWYLNWYKQLSSKEYVQVSDLGLSNGKRPIHRVSIIKNPKNPYIFFLGRQHPPEVSGVFALKGFVENIISGNKLSLDFLNKYNIIAYPLLIPDGVDQGHWRHNLSSKDLNRDWGFFTQPETKLVFSDIQNILSDDKKVIALIDFHSTFKNLFYIQHPDENLGLSFSVNEWLKNSEDDLTNYYFSIRPVKSKDNGVAKNFFFKEFNIPTITYEVGDETDRNSIKQSAITFSKNFMKILTE